jgi:hypothetical protein
MDGSGKGLRPVAGEAFRIQGRRRGLALGQGEGEKNEEQTEEDEGGATRNIESHGLRL